MKKSKKIISNVLTFSMFLIMLGNIVYAADDNAISDIGDSVKRIVDAVSYAGYAVSMGMLAFIGMKYAMSPANEKADVKQGSINYLIGAFFIICASTVANIFVDIAAGSGTEAGSLAQSIVNAGL